MAWFTIFAFVAVAGCAKLQASVGASVSSVRLASSLIAKQVKINQHRKQKGYFSIQKYAGPLWFLPWSSSESSVNDQVPLDERISRLEHSVSENSYWINPPEFFRDLLRLKRALVERELERLKSSDCGTSVDEGKTALHALFQAYAQMETPLPGLDEKDKFGADASLQKIINASDTFWNFAANRWLKPSTGQTVGSLLEARRKGPAAYFLGVLRHLDCERKLKKLLKPLKEADECMGGVYYNSTALNFLSSGLRRCLEKHCTATPSWR